MQFLAVSTNQGDPTPWLEEEAQAVAGMTGSGLVHAAYLKADWSGAVFLLEAPDEAAATSRLATLPLVGHGVTAFVLTALVPLPAAR